MDEHDKNALMSLNFCVAMKQSSYSIMKNWLNAFNRGRRSPKDEIHEGPETAIVPENAVRELIMQDSHVTYREIETFLATTYIRYCRNSWP